MNIQVGHNETREHHKMWHRVSIQIELSSLVAISDAYRFDLTDADIDIIPRISIFSPTPKNACFLWRRNSVPHKTLNPPNFVFLFKKLLHSSLHFNLPSKTDVKHIVSLEHNVLNWSKWRHCRRFPRAFPALFGFSLERCARNSIFLTSVFDGKLKWRLGAEIWRLKNTINMSMELLWLYQ